MTTMWLEADYHSLQFPIAVNGQEQSFRYNVSKVQGMTHCCHSDDGFTTCFQRLIY